MHRFVSGDGWSSILLRVRQKRELLVAMALPESTGAADPALVDSFSSMSPVPAASPSSPLQDGGEGDDELGDDDDSLSRDDEDEDEEGEDEEPRLKYQRLGGSVPSLLSSDAASCLTVAERIIALGTHDGTVHLLDFQGNQVLSAPTPPPPPPPALSLSLSPTFFSFSCGWCIGSASAHLLDTLLLLAVPTSKICQHYGLRQSGSAHKSAFRIRVWKFGYPEENRYYGV